MEKLTFKHLPQSNYKLCKQALVHFLNNGEPKPAKVNKILTVKHEGKNYKVSMKIA